MPIAKPPICVIGIGSSGSHSLSPKLLKLVESATVLVGGQRHLAAFDYLINEPSSLDKSSSVELWPLGDFSQTFEKMRSRYQSDNAARIVVLASGDPLFFGLGRLLLAHFPSEDLVFHPHLSAMQLAFSRIKLPWQDATLLSVHGRDESLLIKAVKRGDRKIALLTDNVMTPGAIAKILLSLDTTANYQMWVCENLGSDGEEQVNQYSPHEAQLRDFAALNVVVLHRIEDDLVSLPKMLPLIGLPDSAFYGFPDRPALITKKEIRLLVLGELEPVEGDTIWDIGAGTGSISVELSRLQPKARIYAIEKTAAGATAIEKNVKRLAKAPIKVVQGRAPDILAGLPRPDRVFIGGSSGQLVAILNWLHHQQLFVWQSSEARSRLAFNQPLRIVCALATAEHLSEAIAWANQDNIAPHWTYHLTQVNIARSMPVGSLTRLHPLNPVTLFTLQFKR